MKTKEITCIAMLTSIIGALLILDRTFGYILADMCPIFIVACMMSFSFKFGKKHLHLLAICIIIVGFIFGNVVSYIYFPISIFVGYISSSKANWKTMLCSYFIGELLVTFILYPIFLSQSPAILFFDIVGFIWLTFYIFSIFIVAFLESIATYIVCVKVLRL